VLALTDPITQHAVGVVTLSRKPLPPLAQALIEVLQRLPAIGGKAQLRD
jgi:hypothetical protein